MGQQSRAAVGLLKKVLASRDLVPAAIQLDRLNRTRCRPLSGPLIRRTDELSAMSMEIKGTPLDGAGCARDSVVQHDRLEISS